MTPVLKPPDHILAGGMVGGHLFRASTSWSCPESSGGKIVPFPCLSVHSSKWKNAEERKVQGMVESFNNILGESILVILQKLAQH